MYKRQILFRRLASQVPGVAAVDPLAPVRAALYDETALDAGLAARWQAWLAAWQARVLRQGEPADVAIGRMDAANPLYLPRNWLAQQAIDAAEQGDVAPLHALLRTLRRPYDAQPDRAAFAARRPEWARRRPGCSALSCSS